MKIAIIGGAGFVGKRLARRLLDDPEVSELVVLDVAPPTGLDDPRVRSVVGDFSDPEVLRAAIDADTSSVYHLAAVVSGQAEAEFDLGMRVNLDASRALLEVCRGLGTRPKVVFSSSTAVYGGDLPDVVTDSTPLTPQTSYGAQKACVELLVHDYTRRGFIDGRVARLPTVSVRAGAANRAASSFASSVVREPLNGIEVVCPVRPETRIWILSPRRAVECLIAVHDLDATDLHQQSLNLPGVATSVGEMVAALEHVAGPEVTRLIRWEVDPEIQAIADSWPAAVRTDRATKLGLSGDLDVEAIVRAYVEDDLGRALVG